MQPGHWPRPQRVGRRIERDKRPLSFHRDSSKKIQSFYKKLNAQKFDKIPFHAFEPCIVDLTLTVPPLQIEEGGDID